MGLFDSIQLFVATRSKKGLKRKTKKIIKSTSKTIEHLEKFGEETTKDILITTYNTVTERSK